jgi:uncharacterized protein (TIGR03437 family)
VKGTSTVGLLLAGLTFAQPATAQVPVVNSILNPATLSPGVSPGMGVLVGGSNLAGGMYECAPINPPLSCGGVSVKVNGRLVPVRRANPAQLTVYLPVDSIPGPATLTVSNHLGLTSNPFGLTIQPYAPGLSRLYDSSSGRELGFFTDPADRAISAANPASPGQVLTVMAVGLGPTSPVVATGAVGAAPVIAAPRLTIGGRQMTLTSAGLGCGLVCEPGNYLVRFQLPSDMAPGEQIAFLEVGGLRSNTVILLVGAPPPQPVVGYLQSFYDPQGKTMSPGMLTYVGGGGFRPDGGGGPCTPEPSYWPLSCQGVTVIVNGHAAAVQFITPNSMLIQIPVELSPGPATLIVERNAGGTISRSSPFSFTLEALSPVLAAQLALPPYASVIVGGSGAAVSPSNPVVAGDSIFIQAAGLGPTSPPLVTGFSPVIPANTVLKPTLTIGGLPCENVLAAVMPGSVGVYQVTAIAPRGLSPGDRPIVLEIGGKRSQAGLMVPVSNQPVIGAVTNAASSLPTIASGSWVTLYGRNLAESRREWREDDIVYDWLPSSLDGVTVAINNQQAVMSFVSPYQINVLAPDDLPVGPVEVTVQGPTGWQKSQVLVKTFAPGLFPLNAPPGTFVVALHADWTYVARPNLGPLPFPGRPAAPGEVIIFYGTGFGPTSPPISGRQRFNGAVPLANPSQLTLLIGGKPAVIKFSGLVGNGLYQINAVIPDLPEGDHEILAVMPGETSARGRFIPVQR